MKISKKLFFTFVFYFSLFITYYSLLNAQWMQYPLSYNGIAYSLGFYNVSVGVSCGHSLFPFNEKIYNSTNSGAAWNLASYPQELRSLPCIQFINATTVYAGGAENLFVNRIYNYNNDFLSFPISFRQKLIIEGRREFFAEYKAAFVKSTDAGKNWQKISQFDTLSGYINDIFFFDANTGYALIDVNPFHNTGFYKTTNGGTNWQFIKLIEYNSLVEKMIFFDMNTGIAKGFNYGGRIYKTTNGGLNWLTINMQTQIDGITFFNSTSGIAMGINEGGTSTNIYRTTNAGNNWDLLTIISGKRLFTNIKSLASTGTAFAVGYEIDSLFGPQKIATMKTTNYGINWTVKGFNPVSMAYGLALADQNNFFIGSGDVT